MSRTAGVASLIAAFVVAGAAGAYSQGMLLNFAAERVVEKYKTSSCEDLRKMRSEGPSFKEKEAIAYLHSDDQARMLKVQALGEYGEAAKSAVPTLERMLKDEDTDVRASATSLPACPPSRGGKSASARTARGARTGRGKYMSGGPPSGGRSRCRA